MIWRTLKRVSHQRPRTKVQANQHSWSIVSRTSLLPLCFGTVRGCELADATGRVVPRIYWNLSQIMSLLREFSVGSGVIHVCGVAPTSDECNATEKARMNAGREGRDIGLSGRGWGFREFLQEEESSSWFQYSLEGQDYWGLIYGLVYSLQGQFPPFQTWAILFLRM